MEQIRTRDGRALAYRLDGPQDAFPLLFCTGTPQGTVDDPELVEAAAAAGLRLLTYDRPGYGRSDRDAGRTVASAARDIEDLLDALGLDGFVAVGHSGGGPHALACGALLAGRCRSVATVAGVAPFEAEGLDFLAGMGDDNVEEFGAAVQGEPALRALLESFLPELKDATAEAVVGSLAGILPPVDTALMTSTSYGEVVAARFRAALSTGVDGWLDDDLAFVQPWGFDLSAIAVPVAVWQGSEDLMVPFAHGQWLVQHVPGATPHLLQGEGHLSVVLGQLPEILAGLTRP